MSRLGKKPVPLPKGVTASVEGQTVKVKGPKGELVTPDKNQDKSAQMWGLSRSLVSNLVTGVTTGFSQKLEIQGVGYRAAVQGKILNLQLGFSHDVPYAIPEGITIVTEKPTMIMITGTDKQKVGQVAAEIRSWRPPEPYKGKGVRYEGEYVRRKEGKKK